MPNASIGTRTRILSLEGINTTLVLWTHDTDMGVAIPRDRTSVPDRGRRPCIAFIAQLAEHALSKRKVTSSILVEGSLIRYGVVGNISACHADARGSIPRFGVFIFYFLKKNKIQKILHMPRFELGISCV